MGYLLIRASSVFLTVFLSMFLGLVSLTGQAAATDPEFIIGFPEDNLSNEWRAAQMNEIRAELAKHPNVKFLMADAKGSVAQNVSDIEKMVDDGAQLLFLGPRKPDVIGPLVSRLRKQGIRIVLLTRRLNSEDYDTFISPDDFKIAYEAAAYMAEKLNGTGRILMLEGVPTTTTAIRRSAGFLAGIADYPGIKVMSGTANYSRNEAIKVVDKLLSSGETFEGIYAHNDAMASGARIVLKGKGIAPSAVPVVSIDFLPETRDAIIKGEQLASFTYPTCGKVGVAAALKILNGEKVPRVIRVPFQLVTPENVNNVKSIY